MNKILGNLNWIIFLTLFGYSVFLTIEKIDNAKKYLVEGYKEVPIESFGVQYPVESCTDEEACEE